MPVMNALSLFRPVIKDEKSISTAATMMVWTLVLFAAVILLTPIAARGQVANNTITGRVTDPSGAVIPRAAVTLKQAATGLTMHTTTNGDGTYSFHQLLAGTYSVVVASSGFKTTTTSVVVTVGQIAEADIQLPVGKETETITVQPLASTELSTQSSTLNYTVGTKQVSLLPLNGRNPYALATLSPGIAPGSFFGQGLSTTRGAVVAAAANNFESNGGVGSANGVLLDGISIAVCCQGQPAVTPSLEVLGQFKVITSNPPAQFGRSSGGFLNIVTKSGTNQLHGDVYEFLRNDVLDAANYFTKRSGRFPFPGRDSYVLPHRFNQFGAFVGGPIVLPHIYHGRDKTFFTFGYEGTRNLSPTFQTTTVPTNLMREGIFTEAPNPIYDPNNVGPDPAHPGQFIRQPIPAACSSTACYPAGRFIPTVSPIAQKVMATLIPAPNASGVANNYNYVTNIIDSENQYNFRVDHNFSSRQRVFVRGTRDVNTHDNYGLFNTAADPTGWTQALTAYLFAAGDTWTVSPSLLFQFTYGFAFQKNRQVPNSLFGNNAGDLGFPGNFVGDQQNAGYPFLSFTGLQSTSILGGSFNLWHHYTHALVATGIWQHGTQQITFGYDGKMILENQQGLGNSAGTFGFTSLFTSGPNPNAAVPAGQSSFDAWASFLSGYPSSGSLTRQDQVAFNQFYNALFLQDDWRIIPKLTLNLGVRFNMETGFKERYNHWANFDPTIDNPLSAVTGIPFKGGVQYLGVSGNPTRTWPTYYKVSPRIGFSYSATPKTVVRGGYSILYVPTSQRGFPDSTVGFSMTTPYVATIDGHTPSGSLENPFPSGVQLPEGPAGGVEVSTGSSISAWVYKNPQAYEQQWNFGVQQSLSRGVIFNLNYAGSHGVSLPIRHTPNDLLPGNFGAPGDQSQVAYLQDLVPNPFFGTGATGVLAASKVQRVQLLSAFPQYAPNTAMSNSTLSYQYYDHGSASYNSLQASLVLSRASGLTGSVAYVWSKLVGNVSDINFLSSGPAFQDIYFMNHERSVSASDVPQRVTGYVTYPLPFGKGQRFGATWPGWANEVAGGWTLNTIISVQSGLPLAMSQTGAQAFAGSRPSFLPGVDQKTAGSTHSRLNGYLNPAAFRLSQSFELGSVSRLNALVRSPLAFQDDVSVIKNIPIYESLSAQFRLEAFNVLNKVQFGAPNAQVGSSSFGVISSQANLPRNIQAALKLFF